MKTHQPPSTARTRAVPRSPLLAAALPFLFAGACSSAPEAAQPSPRATTSPAAGAASVDYEIPEIAYTKYVLDNGLTLIVHEDHKAPIVAVNVWYHVGSKNEPEGRSGFAHLFEHLMFNGSENYDSDYFEVLEPLGATDLNGTTNTDRTNYFQNVPKNALDVALWMESDRMGNLLGAIDQGKLDEQRGVVQNEKRQGENQPYGRVWDLIPQNTYPAGHPYAHTVIGSMDDLNAAELDDVHGWFERYYGPNNATIVLAGDITPEEALQKVRHYFGAFQPSPPIEVHRTWIARRTGEQRQVMQDRVPQARVYKVWNVPEWGSRELADLNLATGVLSSGKTSRLYKRLVYDDQIATDVNAWIWEREIGSSFVIQATARPGGDLAAVEAAIDEELAAFLADGPTPDELERIKAASHAGFLRGIERIGGFGGKSDVLAESEVYGGEPDAYMRERTWLMSATPAEVHRTAREWLSDGVYVLEVHPFPELAAAPRDADRTALPEVGTPPAPGFPQVQKATLANGLTVLLAERHALPLVEMQLLVDAGYAADQQHDPGTANLALNMMDEGTASRTALEISEELARLGATLSTGSSLDVSMVTMAALTERLDPALGLFADVVLNPAFPASDFERLQQQQLAAIQREKATPISMALRVFPVLLFGEQHPYGIPFTGTGTEEAVQALTPQDLERFHDTWFRPNNATLLVAGDVTMAELMPKLEAAFGSWQRGTVPTKPVAQAPDRQGGVLYLMDKPGAQQSIIIAGHSFPPPAGAEEFPLDAAIQILGGSFTSRINMNLREDKHWSYGAFTFVPDARGPRPFITYAPVQTDRTKESIQEVRNELLGIVGDRPPTADELVKVQDEQVLTLPGRWETLRAIRSSMAEQVNLGLPDDYWHSYADHVRGLRLGGVQESARTRIQPDRLIWVVVGDREEIEAGIRELGFDEIRLITPDGEVTGTI